jgi:hypothetical protein
MSGLTESFFHQLLPYSLRILEVHKHPSLFEKIQNIQEERRREIAKQSSRPYDFDWDEDLASQPTPQVVEPKPVLRNPLPAHYTQKDHQPEWDFTPQRFFPREVRVRGLSSNCLWITLIPLCSFRIQLALNLC